MARKRTTRDHIVNECVQFFSYLMAERPKFHFFVPLMLFVWAVERWILPFSNWVPLLVTVWATIQYGSYQRLVLVEDLKRKWKQVILNNSPITPLEHCEWLNKLLMEVWSEFINPKLSKRFSSIVEKRLKHRRPSLIEKIELQEFSFGSSPPILGLHGTRWATSGDQRIMHMGFDWDTSDMSIMLFTKLAKPLRGTARIVINSIHIKGDLLLMPILDGKAILYSFESTPEVRIGIVFGSGGSQTLPATELPGVSSWLVKLFNDTLMKKMVEPRRRCYSLPSVDLRKKAVGGILSVKVVSASKLVRSSMKKSSSVRQHSSRRNGLVEEENLDDNDMQTFIEVELEELTRRTIASPGSSPRWDANFNMVLHEDTGILKFHLYECIPGSVKYDYLASCEIQMKYVLDDSTIFWGIGPGSSVLAKHVEYCGKEVEMVIPFEEINSGELTVRLVLKEWQFSDGSNNSLDNNSHLYSQQSLNGSSNIQSMTGRKLIVTVVEGKDLIAKDRSGNCDPYVKLQYGKALHKTRTIPHAMNPVWNQMFEFDEVGGGEYLKIKCYSEDTFGDDNIGSARVNLEGLLEGSSRDVWVPLEKVNSGELRLKIEAVRDDNQGAMSGSTNGWIELVVIEAKDLIAADLRGTSDPYVRVQYGNMKKRTKVIYKTLNPQWNQTLEFTEDGSPLMLHVKDHNALLPTSSIGDCIVEYKGLLPNETADKWIPLQGVKRGEIHIQITRKVPELQKKSSLDSNTSDLSKANQISVQMRQIITKLRTQIKDGDLEALSLILNDIETVEDVQEDYMLQLETEKLLMLEKINMLGEEIYKSSPPQSRKNYVV
ncbi:synaptotagmin-5 isoform X2 [Telopea speciosissima]|uniref:synaptotagmin-5 isoform X2 n=1 Tax=Telopea speciosissima TaxID=54955 RepID=UPI001CC42F1A|nr:synaptotagmin-5 isoform X2 [Telopea speciosissima]